MSGYSSQQQGIPLDPPPAYISQAYPPPTSDYGQDPYQSSQAGYAQNPYPPTAHQQSSYPPLTSYDNASHVDPPPTELSQVPKADDDVQFAASFSDAAIRRGFIRKVYLILSAQLLVTFAFICVFIFVKPVKDWVQNDGFWFYILAYVTFLVLYFVLVCCPRVRRNYPGNFICLALFTLAFSYMTGAISSFHSTDIVLIAAGITALVCLAITIFAIQTKIDFTMCSGVLFVLIMVLFFFGWACLLTYYTSGPSRIMSCVYGGLAALVFGLFLVYDTQMVVGGRKHELSPEEYIYGALQLYIDVVYIFLIILSLFGSKN